MISEHTPENPRPDTPQRSADKAEIDLRDLLGERTQIVIRHRGERYVLRLTRQNKLLLTK
ncbi:MAG: hemin uptake protein HemP [Rhodobacteraceae bacterium]|nr:hemin uptake protein HemP [Paracoccaceae bacterium]